MLFNNQPLTIPENLGTVARWHEGQGPVVVHIQDLHCNYEVQSRIAHIIDFLARKYGLRLVLVEGNHLPIDTSKLSTFPHSGVKEQISDYFMRQGKITGAEHYAATGAQPVCLEGIENPELYDANLKAVESFLTDETQGYCFDLRELLDEIKPALYNPALLQLDSPRQAWREGSLGLLKYGCLLLDMARRQRMELGAYPQLRQYVDAGRSGVVGDSDLLFAELDALDQALRNRFYTQPQQRELDDLYTRLDIMEKLINLSATPEELAAFRKNPEAFRLQVFVNFLRRQASPAEGVLEIQQINLDEPVAAAAEFYRVADERSQWFVRNSMDKLQQHQTGMAVLITGGFHTQHVLEELQRQGASYLSIKPRLTQPDLVNPYFSLLKNQLSPLEKLLAENQDIFQIASFFRKGQLALSGREQLFSDQLELGLESLLMRLLAQENPGASAPWLWNLFERRLTTWDQNTALGISGAAFLKTYVAQVQSRTNQTLLLPIQLPNRVIHIALWDAHQANPLAHQADVQPLRTWQTQGVNLAFYTQSAEILEKALQAAPAAYSFLPQEVMSRPAWLGFMAAVVMAASPGLSQSTWGKQIAAAWTSFKAGWNAWWQRAALALQGGWQTAASAPLLWWKNIALGTLVATVAGALIAIFNGQIDATVFIGIVPGILGALGLHEPGHRVFTPGSRIDWGGMWLDKTANTAMRDPWTWIRAGLTLTVMMGAGIVAWIIAAPLTGTVLTLVIAFLAVGLATFVFTWIFDSIWDFSARLRWRDPQTKRQDGKPLTRLQALAGPLGALLLGLPIAVAAGLLIPGAASAALGAALTLTAINLLALLGWGDADIIWGRQRQPTPAAETQLTSASSIKPEDRQSRPPTRQARKAEKREAKTLEDVVQYVMARHKATPKAFHVFSPYQPLVYQFVRYLMAALQANQHGEPDLALEARLFQMVAGLDEDMGSRGALFLAVRDLLEGFNPQVKDLAQRNTNMRKAAEHLQQFLMEQGFYFHYSIVPDSGGTIHSQSFKTYVITRSRRYLLADKLPYYTLHLRPIQNDREPQETYQRPSDDLPTMGFIHASHGQHYLRHVVLPVLGGAPVQALPREVANRIYQRDLEALLKELVPQDRIPAYMENLLELSDALARVQEVEQRFSARIHATFRDTFGEDQDMPADRDEALFYLFNALDDDALQNLKDWIEMHDEEMDDAYQSAEVLEHLNADILQALEERINWGLELFVAARAACQRDELMAMENALALTPIPGIELVGFLSYLENPAFRHTPLFVMAEILFNHLADALEMQDASPRELVEYLGAMDETMQRGIHQRVFEATYHASLPLSQQQASSQVQEEISGINLNSIFYWVARVAFPQDTARQLRWGRWGLLVEIPALLGLGLVLGPWSMLGFLVGFALAHRVLAWLAPYRARGQLAWPGMRPLLKNLGQQLRTWGFWKSLGIFLPYLGLPLLRTFAASSPYLLLLLAAAGLVALAMQAAYDWIELRRMDRVLLTQAEQAAALGEHDQAAALFHDVLKMLRTQPRVLPQLQVRSRLADLAERLVSVKALPSPVAEYLPALRQGKAGRAIRRILAILEDPFNGATTAEVLNALEKGDPSRKDWAIQSIQNSLDRLDVRTAERIADSLVSEFEALYIHMGPTWKTLLAAVYPKVQDAFLRQVLEYYLEIRSGTNPMTVALPQGDINVVTRTGPMIRVYEFLDTFLPTRTLLQQGATVMEIGIGGPRPRNPALLTTFLRHRNYPGRVLAVDRMVPAVMIQHKRRGDFAYFNAQGELIGVFDHEGYAKRSRYSATQFSRQFSAYQRQGVLASNEYSVAADPHTRYSERFGFDVVEAEDSAQIPAEVKLCFNVLHAYPEKELNTRIQRMGTTIPVGGFLITGMPMPRQVNLPQRKFNQYDTQFTVYQKTMFGVLEPQAIYLVWGNRRYCIDIQHLRLSPQRAEWLAQHAYAITHLDPHAPFLQLHGLKPQDITVSELAEVEIFPIQAVSRREQIWAGLQHRTTRLLDRLQAALEPILFMPLSLGFWIARVKNPQDLARSMRWSRQGFNLQLGGILLLGTILLLLPLSWGTSVAWFLGAVGSLAGLAQILRWIDQYRQSGRLSPRTILAGIGQWMLHLFLFTPLVSAAAAAVFKSPGQWFVLLALFGTAVPLIFNRRASQKQMALNLNTLARQGERAWPQLLAAARTADPWILPMAISAMVECYNQNPNLGQLARYRIIMALLEMETIFEYTQQPRLKLQVQGLIERLRAWKTGETTFTFVDQIRQVYTWADQPERTPREARTVKRRILEVAQRLASPEPAELVLWIAQRETPDLALRALDAFSHLPVLRPELARTAQHLAERMEGNSRLTFWQRRRLHQVQQALASSSASISWEDRIPTRAVDDPNWANTDELMNRAIPQMALMQVGKSPLLSKAWQLRTLELAGRLGLKKEFQAVYGKTDTIEDWNTIHRILMSYGYMLIRFSADSILYPFRIETVEPGSAGDMSMPFIYLRQLTLATKGRPLNAPASGICFGTLAVNAVIVNGVEKSAQDLEACIQTNSPPLRNEAVEEIQGPFFASVPHMDSHLMEMLNRLMIRAFQGYSQEQIKSHFFQTIRKHERRHFLDRMLNVPFLQETGGFFYELDSYPSVWIEQPYPQAYFEFAKNLLQAQWNHDTAVFVMELYAMHRTGEWKPIEEYDEEEVTVASMALAQYALDSPAAMRDLQAKAAAVLDHAIGNAYRAKGYAHLLPRPPTVSTAITPRRTEPGPDNLPFWIARVLFPKDLAKQLRWGRWGLRPEALALIGLGAVLCPLTLLGTLAGLWLMHQILRVASIYRTGGRITRETLPALLKSMGIQALVFLPYMVLALPFTWWLLPVMVLGGLGALVNHLKYDQQIFDQLELQQREPGRPFMEPQLWLPGPLRLLILGLYRWSFNRAHLTLAPAALSGVHSLPDTQLEQLANEKLQDFILANFPGQSIEFDHQKDPHPIQIKVLPQTASSADRLHGVYQENSVEGQTYLQPQLFLDRTVLESLVADAQRTDPAFQAQQKTAALLLRHMLAYNRPKYEHQSLLADMLETLGLDATTGPLRYGNPAMEVGVPEGETLAQHAQAAKGQMPVGLHVFVRLALQTLQECGQLTGSQTEGLLDSAQLEAQLQAEEHWDEPPGNEWLQDVATKIEKSLAQVMLTEFQGQPAESLVAAGALDALVHELKPQPGVDRLDTMAQPLTAVTSLATVSAPQTAAWILSRLQLAQVELDQPQWQNQAPDVRQRLQDLTHMWKLIQGKSTGELAVATGEFSQRLAGEIQRLYAGDQSEAWHVGQDQRHMFTVTSPVMQWMEVRVDGQLFKFPMPTVREAASTVADEQALTQQLREHALAPGTILRPFKLRPRPLAPETHPQQGLNALGRAFRWLAVRLPGQLLRSWVASLLQFISPIGFLNAGMDRVLRSSAAWSRNPLLVQLGTPGTYLRDAYRRMAMTPPWRSQEYYAAQGEFADGMRRYIENYLRHHPDDPANLENLRCFNLILANLPSMVRQEIAGPDTYLLTAAEQAQREPFALPVVLLGRGYRGSLGFFTDALRHQQYAVNDRVIQLFMRKGFRMAFGGMA